MPGFSRMDQARLARSCSATRASSASSQHATRRRLEAAVLSAARGAVVPPPHRCRAAGHRVKQAGSGFDVRLPNEWVANNPLTDYSLVQEAAEWEKIGRPYRVVYTDD